MKILKVKCLAPTRLDNYLTQQYPALTPGRLNKALRENKIKLNGKKQPLSTRVMAGDEIKLFILDDVLDADRRVEGPAWKNARTPAQVVYDCPQILIVNKPAGVAVDGPEDDTLLNRALLYLNKQGEYKENDLYTPALCHRLDTGTSGLVIIAKTPEAEELFLAAITRNLSLDRLKERKTAKRGGGAAVLALDELSECVSGSPEVEDAVIAKELSESVGRFLDTLPPETRKLFLRRYFFLESAEEIAQMYAMRPGTVTVALHRTRKKLREHLKREGFFDE